MPLPEYQGGVGNMASPRGDSPEGWGGALLQGWCLLSGSKGPCVTGDSHIWAEWRKQTSLLWLQGCPADRNRQCPSTGPPGQWEDHCSRCRLQLPRAPLTEGEGPWRVDPNHVSSPAQILPLPLATSLTLPPQPSGQWVRHSPMMLSY